MNLGKNFISKFHLNLLLQISKALVYSKIQFLFRKEFSFNFRPKRPNTIWPFCPEWPTKPRPLPFLPSSLEPAAPPPPPLVPLRHGHRTALLPCHGATPMDATLFNSVTCLYSIVNPPTLFTVCNRCLHGRHLYLPPAPIKG
jgi:hypothetical protein